MTDVSAVGATVLLVTYSPPQEQTLTLRPNVILDDGTLKPS
ncbi:MAG TPA: hypothetical protein VL793_11560 [Patescibacteria group bacterium]|nr:hypothetical protein [Patescibacteria group bacterium]